MKTCPKCNRTFPDEGQKFCTFDGGLLIAPQTFDPNATMRATSIDLNASSERPTSRDLPDQNATMMDSYPATVALPRNTGPTGHPTNAPNTADLANQAPPPPSYVPPPPPPAPPAHTSQPLPPPSGSQHPSAPLAAPQSGVTSSPLPAPPVAKKKSKAPLIIAGVLLFLLLSGGALAGVFFFVVKPKLDEMAADRQRSETPPVVQPTAEVAPTVEQSSPTPEDTFVPPPNTVQFENSNANLDGKLAEHYFDFSFYYPRTWELDPRAGVPGAGNFVKVERRLSPDSIQENFAVGWYTSTGTFAGDSRNFPQRVQEVSAALARAYPEYRKVSEGPTKVNSMDAYEFRWEGLSKGADESDINLWGRVVFLPTGKEGDTTGATFVMLSTSLAPELSSVEDIGEKGEAKVILDSFRFGKK